MWKPFLMKKFPRKEMSLEISATILARIFSENSYTFSRKFSQKCQYKYEISEMNIRLLRRSACLRVQKKRRQSAFVCCRGGATPDMRFSEVQQQQQCAHVRSTCLDGYVAPGQRLAVPSGSLLRHSAGCVRLKDVRCRPKK